MRVLLADNDAEWLDLVSLDLGLEGHDIVGRATSGAEALALVDQLGAGVDAAVVDHRMPPGLTGLEVVRELRRTRPELHVILFTNYPDPTLAAAVEAIGAVLVPKHSLRRLREAVDAAAVNRPEQPPRR